MAKVAAYARFSMEKQDGNSIDAQLTKIREAAKAVGDEIVAIYKDEGETARTPDREQAMVMFDAIKSGALVVKKVYVFKFSRFMRNPEESVFLKRRLDALGVDVVSVMEPLPSEGYMANIMERVIELFDGLQSEIIGIHVLSGMEELAARGYWTGGPAPFGYDNFEIDNREGHTSEGQIVKRGTLIINENEARIVRRIFEIAIATGFGGHRIYQLLCKEMGGPILGRKGKPLGGRGINAILRKPIYNGLFIYGSHGFKLVYDENQENNRRMKKKRYTKPLGKWVKKQNEDWRIVSDELWEAAQRNRLENTKADFGHGPKRASYLLTGMIVCGVCGNSVGGHWQHSKNYHFHYYRCRGAMNGAGICSNCSKIIGLDLESAVVKAIEATFLTPGAADRIVEEIIELRKADEAARLDRNALRCEIDQLGHEIERLADLAAKLPDTAEIAIKIAQRENRRKLLETEFSAIKPPAPALDIDSIKLKVQERLGRTLAMLKSSADMAGLRLELKKWIEAIRLDGDGSVWIKWKNMPLANAVAVSIPPSDQNWQPLKIESAAARKPIGLDFRSQKRNAS